MTAAVGRGLLVVATILFALGCSDDEPSPASTTTTDDPGTVAPSDPELARLLITAGDLPDGFAPSPDVDDTITTFCAGQDATAGLSASARAIAGFTRTPSGASVIEVIFRFDGEGAATFVAQAEDLLASCDGVPDATGLAFEYDPLSPSVATELRDHVAASRFGRSVGSGNLTVQVAVLREDDIGVLVAVLGLDQTREDSDALAQTAFASAIERLRSR